MKTATVRDLGYPLSEIEARLGRGKEIEIRKRPRVIARLVPTQPKRAAYPDFAARDREIFGGRITELTPRKSWPRIGTGTDKSLVGFATLEGSMRHFVLVFHLLPLACKAL